VRARPRGRANAGTTSPPATTTARFAVEPTTPDQGRHRRRCSGVDSRLPQRGVVPIADDPVCDEEGCTLCRPSRRIRGGSGRERLSGRPETTQGSDSSSGRGSQYAPRPTRRGGAPQSYARTGSRAVSDDGEPRDGYLPSLLSFARAHYDLVIGDALADAAVDRAAVEFPGVHFALIDWPVAAPPHRPGNVQSVSFAYQPEDTSSARRTSRAGSATDHCRESSPSRRQCREARGARSPRRCSRSPPGRAVSRAPSSGSDIGLLRIAPTTQLAVDAQGHDRGTSTGQARASARGGARERASSDSKAGAA
jgi:hypothetical protein